MSKTAFELHQSGPNTVGLVNMAGQSAFNVEVSISGPVVVSGKRDWKRTAHEVGDGEAIEVTYQTGFGGEVGAIPTLHVGFHLLHNGVLHWSQLSFVLERS